MLDEMPEPAKAKKACVFCRKKKTKCVKPASESQCDNCKKRQIACEFDESPPPLAQAGVNKSWKFYEANFMKKSKSTGTMHAIKAVNFTALTPSESSGGLELDQEVPVPAAAAPNGSVTQFHFEDDSMSDSQPIFDPMELLWDVEGFERQLEENIGKTFDMNNFDLAPDLSTAASTLNDEIAPLSALEKQQHANMCLLNEDVKMEDASSASPNGPFYHFQQPEKLPANSTATNTATTMNATTTTNPNNPNATNNNINTNNNNTIITSSLHHKRTSISQINPQTQTSEDLFNLFFTTATYLSDMINREKFRENMNRNIPLTLTLGDSILAQTYLILNSPQRAAQYYFKARLGLYKFLDDEEFISTSFYSVTSIQILLILSDYELKVGKWAASSLTFARALMMLRMRSIYIYDIKNPFSLNKKLDDEFQKNSDESYSWPEWMTREETRKTFYKVYCYDKYFALYKGVNENIPHDRVRVQLPLDESLHKGMTEPSFKRPFIKDILPRIKNGEKIKNLGFLTVHILLLSLLSDANMWNRSICMNEDDVPIDIHTIKRYIAKMNEFIIQMEWLNTNYREESDLYNRLGNLVREITKLKLYHGILFVIGQIHHYSPEKFTSEIDYIYYELKEKCLNQTINLIQVFDKLDLGKLVCYNPFFSLALHSSIKSAIQLFIILKQPNCTQLDASSVSQLFNQISKVITQLENLEKRPPLLSPLILFYSEKLESYDSDPYANVFFEDTLLFRSLS